jgi:DNA-binding FadR family transcriptional regulator
MGNTKLNYEPVVNVSLAKQISERILESITDGTLKADDQLPTEEVLASQFQVSRPTIREALKRLAAQSLIRSRRGPSGGTFVNRPSIVDASSNLSTSTSLLVSLGEFSIPEILEARRGLELLCVQHAVERRVEAELNMLEEELLIQKNQSISDTEFCDSDVRFHRILADATHNPVLQFIMFSVIEALQPIENMVVFRVRDRKVVLSQHQKMVDALKQRDETSASEAVKEQTVYLNERFQFAQKMRKEKRAK